jgi:biotin carboxylase
MIVLDRPGHWLEGETYAHLREDFIAIDLSNDTGLPSRIADAVRDRGIKGIVTFTDEYVVTTAEAATILGLPTEQVHSMQQAHHKHKMRQLVNNRNTTNNIQAVHLKNAETMNDPVLAKQLEMLQYPLVVKPCRGQFSRGVKKVNDAAELRQAARMLDHDGLAEQGILLETYVDGPEIDANFVLWDGEILFLEVTDNFPCPGDASGATVADNFAETLQISNSGFPAEEIEIVRSSLKRSLLQLGFRSGVFHVEARMQNSSMRYQDVKGEGILDLITVPNSQDSACQPDVFLIEVNARPPGTGGTWSTLYTYGVDLGALQLLRALEDRERFEALSHPFSFSRPHPGDGGGAQYWNAHCMVPVHRDQICVPGDFLERLYEALPEIMPHISRAELSTKPGTVLSTSGGIPWIAYILLYSRTSRRHV